MKSKLISIKTKLNIISCLLVTIPLLFLGFFSYNSSKNHLDGLGAINLRNSVEITLELIEALHLEVEKGHIPLEEAQERVKVAVLGEKRVDGTRPINPDIDLGEYGYIFIIDSKGTQVAHPYLEGENQWDIEDGNGVKVFQEIVKAGQSGGEFVYFDWPLPGNDNRIEPKVTFSKTDPYWGWTVSAGTYMLDFNKDAQEIFNLVLITIIISLLIGLLVIWIFANNIANPINRVSEHMNVLASGDLSREPLIIKSRDEVGELAQAMNQMQSSIKEVIQNMALASETITSHSEEFTHSANEVREGGEQIAATMQELATGSESQASSATNLTEMMDVFNKKVVEANQHGEEIDRGSEQVLDMAEEGNRLMIKSVSQMENIHQKVSLSVNQLQGLDERIREISQLVNVIQGIAAQTNLLSLNAAIEAARAGEHGLGFAVVADEVRKLSDEVAHSVEQITGIVTGILEGSDQVADSLQTSYEEVEAGTEQIRVMGETFTNINTAVTNMVSNVHTIAANLNDLAQNSDQMSHTIEEIAAVAEETAAGVEETAAAAQQSSTSMVEIAANAEELATLAEQLNKQIRNFTL